MSEFLDWLPGVLRDAGVDVYVMPGAETRTTRSSGLSVRGVVWHHTATGPNWLDGHVAALLARGRKDLAGPLSQVGIERDGTWVIVALGRANHNGFGTWGNDALGLEFYNSGTGEPWSDVQVESGVRGTAAVLRYLNKPISAVLGHRETDPRRKIDPAGLNMTTIRQRVDASLRHPTEDDMPLTTEDVNKVADAVWGRQLKNQLGLNAPAHLVLGDIFVHARQAARAQGVDVDEAAIISGVLEGLPAETIAAAIPDGIADRVADVLAERLKG